MARSLEEIEQLAQAQYAAAEAAGDQAGMIKSQQLLNRVAERRSVQEFASNPPWAFVRGGGEGVQRVFEDVVGLPRWLEQKITGNKIFDQYREGVRARRATWDPYLEASTAANIGNIAGSVAATAPIGSGAAVAGAARVAPRLAHLMAATGTGRAATSAVTGAAGGALGADNPTAGAAFGAGGALAGDMFARLFKKSGEVLPDVAPEDMPAGFENVPRGAADVFPRHGPGRAGQLALLNPTSRRRMDNFRHEQATQLDQSLNRIKERYTGEVEDLPSSLADRMRARKRTAGNLYNELGERMAGRIPEEQSWRETAQGLLDEQLMRPEGRQNADLVTAMSNYLQEPGSSDWNALRNLRSDIGADIRGGYSGQSQIGSRAVPGLQQVKNALGRDLDAAAEAAESGLWRTADTYYRENVASLYGKDPSLLKRLMASESPEKVAKTILSPTVADDRTLVRKLNAGLTERGRQAVRRHVTEEAFDAGRNAEGFVSPASISTYISKRKPLFEEMMPDVKWDDVTRVLRQLEEVGSAGRVPKTGYGAAILESPMSNAALSAAAGMSMGGGDPVRSLGVAGGTMLLGTTLQTALGQLAASIALGNPQKVARGLNALSDLSRAGGAAAGRAVGHTVPQAGTEDFE